VGGRSSSYHEPGNFTAFFGTVIPEVDVYDFGKKEWRTLANGLPNPTAAGGLVELGGDIYYFGGESSQPVAHNATQRLNLKTGTWTVVSPLQRGRHGSGAVVINGKIYVAAGSGGRGGSPELSSTEVFSLGH
jgi:N-acetylneuraminic acid mutarotase